jgi:hypothetical protein
MSEAYIYFFRPKGQEGPVKVGFSIYPEARLITYMAWSPVPLEVVAVVRIEGDGTKRQGIMRVERQFHTRYDKFRLHHEWFLAHPRLLRDIELIRAGRFRLSWLPEPGPVPWAAKMRETKQAMAAGRRLREGLAA